MKFIARYVFDWIAIKQILRNWYPLFLPFDFFSFLARPTRNMSEGRVFLPDERKSGSRSFLSKERKEPAFSLDRLSLRYRVCVCQEYRRGWHAYESLSIGSWRNHSLLPILWENRALPWFSASWGGWSISASTRRRDSGLLCRCLSRGEQCSRKERVSAL